MLKKLPNGSFFMLQEQKRLTPPLRIFSMGNFNIATEYFYKSEANHLGLRRSTIKFFPIKPQTKV